MKLKLAALALLATAGWAAAADMGAAGPLPKAGAGGAAGRAAPADMGAPVPYPKAAAGAPGYVWSGFYIGAQGGFGWLRNQGADFNGGFAGGAGGANRQMSTNVVGVGGAGAWADIGRTTTTGLIWANADVQAFGSVTGRLGLALDNFLIYGKG